MIIKSTRLINGLIGLFSILFLTNMNALGQSKVTVMNGDWDDPQIWSPVGVPGMNEDTVVVNHEVSLNQDTGTGINHFWIASNGMLNGSVAFGLGGSIVVDGEVHVNVLTIGNGDYSINNNLIDVEELYASTNPSNENNGSIFGGTVIVDEDFFNSSEASITVDTLIVNAEMSNMGMVHAVNMLNSGELNGDGSFCIDSCFQNSGNVIGTLDVCDATASGLTCDFNFGTIASTVTTCSNSVCATVGLEEFENEVVDFNVLYDGVTNSYAIEVTEGINYSLIVIDIMGRTVYSVQSAHGKVALESNQWQTGAYIINVVTDNQASRKTIRIVNQ